MVCYSYPVWPKETHDHQERQEIALSASEAQRLLEQARKDNIALVEQNLELKKSYQTLQAIMKRQAEIIEHLLNSASLTPYHIQPSKEAMNSITSSSNSKPFKFLPSSQKYFKETKREGFSSLLTEVQKDKFLDVKISFSSSAKFVPLAHKPSILNFQVTPNSLMSKVNFSFQPSLESIRKPSSHYSLSSSQEIEGASQKEISYKEQEPTHMMHELNEQNTDLEKKLKVQDEHTANQQDLLNEEEIKLLITELENKNEKLLSTKETLSAELSLATRSIQKIEQEITILRCSLNITKRELEQSKAVNKELMKEFDEEKQAYKNLQKRIQAVNRQNFNLSQENSLLKDEKLSLLTQIDSKLTKIKKQEVQLSILQEKLLSSANEQEILERRIYHYTSTIKSFYENIHALTQYFKGVTVVNDLGQISKQWTPDQELSLEDINDYLNIFSSTAVSILPLTTKKTDESDVQPLP